MSTFRDLVTRCVLVLMFGATLMAQVGTQGSILGAVVDSSQSALPGATIVVTNLDTGLTQQAVSDASGNFEILALPIGSYSVTVSMQGFKSWKIDRLVLSVGDRSRVSPQLEVGNVSEEDARLLELAAR